MNETTLLDGRYSLPDEPAGAGAHAKLYKAFDLKTHRHVAVKAFLKSEVHDERVLTRAWQNELEVYSKLDDNVNLTKFIDFGKQSGGEPYLVFEWLEGDLWAYLKQRPVEGWDDFWPSARDILRGLSDIHDAGYVHRDIKPENVLHGEDGIQKVADFGTTRLIESVNIGLTMAPLGTYPYCPPEISTQNPSCAYDIFSFAVLVVCCVTGKVPQSRDGVLELLHDADLPQDISEIFEECLAIDPESRPQSASVLLAQLVEIQSSKEERRRERNDIFLDVSDQKLTSLSELLGGSIQQARERILAELAGSVFAHYHDRGNFPAFEFITDTLLFRLQPHGSGRFLRVLTVRHHSPELSDKARSQWLQLHARFRLSAPVDPDLAEWNLQDLLEEIRDHDARLAAAGHAESTEFRVWKSVLQAKFDDVKSQGKNIAFTAWRKEGNRIYFDAPNASYAEAGESRLARAGQRPIVFGEVEKATDTEIVFYIERGSTDRLSKSGVLEFDAQASLGKLKREQFAVERLQEGNLRRPELKHILLDPSKNCEPLDVPVPQFGQPGLDEAKQAAVRAALGNQDFLLVQGPPGTGKTTFIAELVYQILLQKPNSRILLASQTHVALDNALVRIANLCPNAILVRVGREDKLSEDAMDFSLASVLASWTTRVHASASEFIRKYAANLGIDLDGPDIQLDVADFSMKLEKRASLRSKVATRQAERGILSKKIDDQRLLGEKLLSAALRLETASAGGVIADLVAASKEYVEIGLRVAERLELDQGATTRLSEIEASLQTWRDDIRSIDNDVKALKARIASNLGLADDLEDSRLVEIAADREPSRHPEISKLQDLSLEWSQRFSRTDEFAGLVLAEANVVAATCVGLGSVRGSESIFFDLCIVDEASKATATESLVPLVASDRWVLVGDNRQLPPFIEHALQSPPLLAQYDLTPADVRQNLFDLLNDELPSHSRIALTHQHRMHPVIGKLVSDCFYDGTLTSQSREVSPVVTIALGAPVLWADTSFMPNRRESKVGHSFANNGEVRVISRILDRLQFAAQGKSVSISVAVLTGYEAQRRELQKVANLESTQRPNLRIHVANVDSFQGQEADVAIFSVTRSNAQKDPGFLQASERLNVALSRARDGLVVVGDGGFVAQIHESRSDLVKVWNHVGSNADCVIESVNVDA